MISINSTSIPPTSHSINELAGDGSAHRWVSYDAERGSCGWHLQRVVDLVEDAEVREIVRVIFGNMHRLLECLGLIESYLRQVEAADETFALYRLIHDDARELVEFIRNDALNCASVSAELADTLDGVTFVINHDLQRIFEHDPRGPLHERTAPSILSKVHRDHDVLTNCLQQSTISLAMVFDASLVGAKLFDNSDIRHRQSLQLCQDLQTLRQLVENCEEQNGDLTLLSLEAAITRFRNESMECLMYSDWPQFESFCEAIKGSSADNQSLVSVLHQFQCYLETLLSQVRMRAVLVEQGTTSMVPPNPGDFKPNKEENQTAPEAASFALAI